MENDIGYCKNGVTNSFLFSDRLVDIDYFVVQASMTFSSVFGTYVERFNLGYRPVNLTQGIFSGFRGLYTSILPYLFYYFPLLTMGLMSRELSSGSVKLLYSSPVNNIQIILGKFVSMMIYALVFVGILLVFIIFGACTIDHFVSG